MTFENLIAGLSRPEAYPFAVETVRVCQTHISVVFLAGDRAFKIKKPVTFGFLDYSTLERRRHFCDEEVRLNRRWAPDVYVGVVPIVERDGRPHVGGEGAIVEYAVEMRRLPDNAQLRELVRAGTLDRTLCELLGRRVASVHALARRDLGISAFARFDAVARNARENLQEAESLVGTVLSREVSHRLSSRLEESLLRWRPLLDARADRGVPCETHGDLRLEHVYYFPDRLPPGDLVAIDGIEFNERFRYADPVADMAFLYMEMRMQGRRDLAEAFAGAYFQTSGDGEGRGLLAFYSSYRAAIRGKVQGLKFLDERIPQADRDVARSRARAFWLLALSELEPPGQQPCLVLMAGLPGTGKTTLARSLAARAGCVILRSDVIRKEFADSRGAAGGVSGFEEGLYSAEWTRRTYEACLDRARESLFEGRRVIVDAGFRLESQRLAFAREADAWGVPFSIVHCAAPLDVLRERLAGRRNDASDADWGVTQKLAGRWEDFGLRTRPAVVEVDTSGPASSAVDAACEGLRRAGLLGS
jgi:aminoglycoside phosphotransferase family enzyme/predicted kinase